MIRPKLTMLFLLSFCMLLLAANQSLAKVDISNKFYAQYSIETPQEKKSLYKIQLNYDIYQHAYSNDFKNIYIFDSNNNSVPYALIPQEENIKIHYINTDLFILDIKNPSKRNVTTTIESFKKYEVSIFEAAKSEDFSQLYMLKNSDNKTIAGMRFNFVENAANFIATITIEHSDNFKNWQSLGNFNIAKLTTNEETSEETNKHTNKKAKNLLENEISFPSTQKKYIRFKFTHPIKQSPIESIDIKIQNKTQQKKIVINKIKTIKIDNHSIEFSIPEKAQIDNIAFQLKEEGIYSYLHLFKKTPTSWQEKLASEIFWLNNGNKEFKKSELALNNLKGGTYKVTFTNPINDILKTPFNVDIKWSPKELIFLAAGKQPYKLAYGNNTEKNQSALPLSRLLELVNMNNEQTVNNINSAYLINKKILTEKQPVLEKSDNNTHQASYLWLVFLAIFTIIIFMIRKLFSELNNSN